MGNSPPDIHLAKSRLCLALNDKMCSFTDSSPLPSPVNCMDEVRSFSYCKHHFANCQKAKHLRTFDSNQMPIRHSLMFLSYTVLLNTRQCVILYLGCLYSLPQSRYFGETILFLMFFQSLFCKSRRGQAWSYCRAKC